MQEFSDKVISCVLVDDDQDDLEIFGLALKRTGMEIKFSTARDGYEGLRLLDSLDTIPDFIFLDLNMPNLDGKKCLEKIREKSEYQQTPVIIYSTSSYINDIRETRRLGATGFITKPTNIDLLTEMLKKIFTRTYSFQTSAYYQ